jgi:twitching motility protein PilT
MIDYLNQTEKRNIISIEDPIEFMFHNNKSIIRQRDLGDDTKSFANALVHILRHDPDGIVIGEMRDLATISTAVQAAETGHLVLGTLHTFDAPQSFGRIIDLFPYGQQQQIRLQLSQVIEEVLSQMLLPCTGGGRVAAFEIMVVSNVMRKLIREGKTFEMLPNIELGAPEGMQTMDQALADLLRKGVVSRVEATKKKQ